MKRTLFHGMASLCMVGLSACSSATLTDAAEDATYIGAIRFASSADTRAAVEKDFTDGDAFSVWGWCRPADGSDSQTEVFHATEVTKHGVWSYEGTRYWADGHIYRFYAAYPHSAGVSFTEEGGMSLSGFDCSKFGAEAVDLMTTVSSDIYARVGTDMPPVPLTFYHELARIHFIVQSDIEGVRVNRLYVYGMDYRGDFARSTYDYADGTEPTTAVWTNTLRCALPTDVASSSPGQTGSTATPYDCQTPFDVPVGKEGVNVLGDLLLIPQRFAEADERRQQIYLEYTLDGETFRRYIPLRYPVKVERWNRGQQYRYTLSISGKTDLVLRVSVLDWELKDMEVEW